MGDELEEFPKECVTAAGPELVLSSGDLYQEFLDKEGERWVYTGSPGKRKWKRKEVE